MTTHTLAQLLAWVAALTTAIEALDRAAVARCLDQIAALRAEVLA